MLLRVVRSNTVPKSTDRAQNLGAVSGLIRLWTNRRSHHLRDLRTPKLGLGLQRRHIRNLQVP